MIFFDLETTGVDRNRDRIVQICMIKASMEQREPKPLEPWPRSALEVRTKLINPGMPIPESASEIHGIYDKDVADAPTFKQLAKGIMAFIEDEGTIVGFNSNFFDVPILNMEFERAGLIWDWEKHNFVDAGSLYKIQNPRTLAAAYRHYTGGDMVHAHDAEADVRATMVVFNCIMNNHYPEVDDMRSMEFASNYEKTKLDLNGCFILEGTEPVYSFGKHKGKLVKDNTSYLAWMISQGDFSQDTKDVAANMLKEYSEEKHGAH